MADHAQRIGRSPHKRHRDGTGLERAQVFIQRPGTGQVQQIGALRINLHGAATSEINGRQLGEASEETIPSHVGAAINLPAEEHYGRGLVEDNEADLFTLDRGNESMLDWMAAASSHRPWIDEESDVTEEDLKQAAGVPIRCRGGSDGRPKDWGWCSPVNVTDFKVVEANCLRVADSIRKSFMNQAGSIRDSERTTRGEVELTVQEVQASLGTLYPSIAAQMQLPRIARITHMMEVKGLLPILPKELGARVQILTGLPALANQTRASALLESAEVAARLGPAAIEEINPGNMLATFMRYRQVTEPGVLRTSEEKRAIREQAMRDQLAMQAGERTVDALGTIAEQSAQAAQPAPG